MASQKLDSPFSPREVQDSVFTMESGVDMNRSPLLLEPNTLASGTNVTVRGDMVTQRPPFRKIEIQFDYPSDMEFAFETGKYQGGNYYKPDNGFESLLVQIGGRLFQLTPGSLTASIIERTIPGDPNPVGPDQVWMWQAEKWMIIQDGISVPEFFDQTAIPTTRRSTWNTKSPFSTTVATGNVIPALGSTFTVTMVSTANMVEGDSIAIKKYGYYTVQSIAGNVATLVNVSGVKGTTIPTGPVVSWFHVSTELPPGRMGAYGMGQNWFALVDGRSFVASDQVGASSGTQAEQYRDAVLNITQNNYLAGGGVFLVPGTAGDIRAMVFVPTLDASLGQGPLQVLTPNTVFTCTVPPDRLTWQDITNPILAESMITNGGLGQWSTVLANSDTIMRSIDGIRSEILARRDFNTWGNVPISQEMDPILSKDPPSTLQLTSAIVFDNRLLMTADPVVTDHNGVYWKQLIALNFDPVSSLRGKAPSVYDGSWTGLNVLQLITGQFSGVQRAFAFCFNAITEKIELYEILRQDQAYFDNDTRRIVSVFQTSCRFHNNPGKTPFDLVRLIDGENYIDSIRGTTDVQVWYRPDCYPCWIPWNKYSVCNPVAQDDPRSHPGYRTRIGLGEPSGRFCEQGNNRPLRTGFWFQFRFVITGPFRFLGSRFKAVFEPQSQYAKVAGCCETDGFVLPVPPTPPVPSIPSAPGTPSFLAEDMSFGHGPPILPLPTDPHIYFDIDTGGQYNYANGKIIN